MAWACLACGALKLVQGHMCGFLMKSDRVVQVDELDFDTKPARNFFAQGLGTIALGGVVTGSHEGNTVFLRAVEGLLRGFSTDVKISLCSNGTINKALSPSRAPGYSADFPL